MKPHITLWAAVALTGAATMARADGSTVAGMVRWAGAPRAASTLPVTQDPAVCGSSKPDETLLVDKSGGVRNVVVSLVGVPAGAKPAPVPGKLDQNKCQFSPHVQALPFGSSVTVGNSDPVLHNVHGMHGDNTVFNLAMPIPKQQVKRKLPDLGLTTFRCDAGHVWMSAHVWTFEHPYFAVTDAAGRFSIAGVPPGSYTVQVSGVGGGTGEALVEIYEVP